jgi:dihydroorotate dehydrogenase
VRAARDIVRGDDLGLALAAVGGVSSNADFEDCFNAGANAVFCGSAPMYLPHLAIASKHAHPEW